MLMHLRARYRSSLVLFEIFECTPTRRNIIFFIYILIGPHRHGSKENPSHRSSAVFISSLCLFFFLPLSNRSVFRISFALVVKGPPSPRSFPRASFYRPYPLILFFHLSSFSRPSFLQLSLDLRAIASLPAFIPECHLHVMVVSSFQATYKRSLL